MSTGGTRTGGEVRWTRPLLLAGVILWCAAILAAPVAGLDSVYAFFAAICHQDPERSWFIGPLPLAVCIRCASIYFGFLGGLLAGVPASPRLLRVALAATMIEFVCARVGFDYEPARAVTGLMLGLAAAGFVEAGISELFGGRFQEERTSPS